MTSDKHHQPTDREMRVRQAVSRAADLGRKREHIDRHVDLKLRAFAILGGMCVWPWCGETDPDMLCIDHVNDDGHEHRKAVKGDGLYLQIINGACQHKLQLLCASHNQKKQTMLCRGEPLPEMCTTFNLSSEPA